MLMILSHYDVWDEDDDKLNLRTNSFKEGEDNYGIPNIKTNDIQDLKVKGPLIRGNNTKLKIQLEQYIINFLGFKSDEKIKLNHSNILVIELV